MTEELEHNKIYEDTDRGFFVTVSPDKKDPYQHTKYDIYLQDKEKITYFGSNYGKFNDTVIDKAKGIINIKKDKPEVFDYHFLYQINKGKATRLTCGRAQSLPNSDFVIIDSGYCNYKREIVKFNDDGSFSYPFREQVNVAPRGSFRQISRNLYQAEDCCFYKDGSSYNTQIMLYYVNDQGKIKELANEKGAQLSFYGSGPGGTLYDHISNDIYAQKTQEYTQNGYNDYSYFTRKNGKLCQITENGIKTIKCCGKDLSIDISGGELSNWNNMYIGRKDIDKHTSVSVLVKLEGAKAIPVMQTKGLFRYTSPKSKLIAVEENHNSCVYSKINNSLHQITSFEGTLSGRTLYEHPRNGETNYATINGRHFAFDESGSREITTEDLINEAYIANEKIKKTLAHRENNCNIVNCFTEDGHGGIQYIINNKGKIIDAGINIYMRENNYIKRNFTSDGGYQETFNLIKGNKAIELLSANELYLSNGIISGYTSDYFAPSEEPDFSKNVNALNKLSECKNKLRCSSKNNSGEIIYTTSTIKTKKTNLLEEKLKEALQKQY